MGWTYMPATSLSGFKTKRHYLDNQLTWTFEREGVEYSNRVLKSAFVGSTYYAAVEKTGSDGSRTVWAAITLTRSNPNAADGLVFGYKDMDETVGPYHYDCPANILDLLTPTKYEYAMKWRKSCRETLALKGRKLDDGDIIELPEPMTFSDGAKSAIFTVRKVRQRRRLQTELRIEGLSGRYKITALMKRQWKKLPKPPPSGTFFGTA